MTTTIQTTDLIGTGIQFDFAAAFDNYYVSEGVTVASTDFTAIRGLNGNNSLHVDGTVVGGDLALLLTAGDNVVSVGTTGVVRSFGITNVFSSIFLTGGNNTVNNAGLIEGERIISVFFRHGDNDMLNTGTVIGSTGVFLGESGGAGDRLVNSGAIYATDVNPNASVRFNHGVFTEGNDTEIVNQAGGLISASGAAGAGVSIGGGFETADRGDGSRVVNHGEITSAQFWGVDFFNMTAAETAELVNYGTIGGATGAFRGNQSGEQVRNGGLMLGDVDLRAGNDTFDGRGGEVSGEVRGGSGNDLYIISDATISLVENAGRGTDEVRSTVSYQLEDNFENLTLIGGGDVDGAGNSLGNTIEGNVGDNRLDGAEGGDELLGRGGNDVLLGGIGLDILRGGNGDDELRGGNQDDVLPGNDGNDLLLGGAGNDKMFGQNGDDVLNSGLGLDRMVGGSGADRFVFNDVSDSGATPATADRIDDFQAGLDLVDISALSNQVIDFLGAGAFTGSGAPEARAVVIAGSTRLLVDIDGDATKDSLIFLQNFAGLAETDLVL